MLVGCFKTISSPKYILMINCFATVARGLEELAAQELQQLGAEGVEPGFCGVGFRCDRTHLYKINLWARLPFRILVTMAHVPCRDGDTLYRGIQSLDWDPYLSPDHTLAVKATGKNQHLNHSHFTALQVKNAIVDQQQDRHGERSDIDTERPDVQVNVHIKDNNATVSLDSSGSSLHRRGYRPAMGTAPLKESLAAALVQLTDWSGEVAFLDPMCGSGTLPIEATLQALNIAPGLFRDETSQGFGFQTWPDYDANLWQQLVDEAQKQQTSELMVPVWGAISTWTFSPMPAPMQTTVASQSISTLTTPILPTSSPLPTVAFSSVTHPMGNALAIQKTWPRFINRWATF